MLDDIREWISDNLRYILLGLAILLVLIILFCVIRLVSGAGKKNNNQTDNAAVTTNTQSDEAVENATEGENKPAVQQTAEAAASDELVRDDAAVLTLVRKYYTAVAAKDVTTLSEVVSPWNEQVQNVVFGNPDIESYNNLTTYSRKGVADGSYVVYAYYESKISDIETLVPSLSRMYLVKNDDGSLVVSSDYDSDQEILDYVNKVSADGDVQKLVSDVNEQYQRAVDADEDLKAYVATLNTGTAAEENEGDGTDTASDSTAATGGREMTVTANTGLNIRQTPSTEAAIVGSVYHGATVTMLEEAEGGWCKIKFDSTAGTVEGYVMLQYLADAS